MMRRQDNSTLFPYTTLFRSAPRRSPTSRRTPPRRSPRARWNSLNSTRVDFFAVRSEEHTSELQSHVNRVCRLLLEKKKRIGTTRHSTKYGSNLRLTVSRYST